METVTLTKISYHELEQIINELFPKADYNFSADMEVNNDTVTEFGDITKEGFNKLLRKEKPHHIVEFMLFVSGDAKGGIYNTRTILLYLVWLEILPEGNYLIEVSY